VAQPPGDGPAETELVDRARRGDHAAFKVLVERYQDRVYALARRILRDPEQARDAVQEGFLKAYAGLERFEGRSGFYTWLYRLVFNQCIDMKRRDRSARHDEWDDEIARDRRSGRRCGCVAARDRAGRSGPVPTTGASCREALAAAIESLPEDARRTLVLREVDGLSYEEIARRLRIPKGTVMSRLHYARRRVRDTLIANGAVEDGRGANEPEPGEPHDRIRPACADRRARRLHAYHDGELSGFARWRFERGCAARPSSSASSPSSRGSATGCARATRSAGRRALGPDRAAPARRSTRSAPRRAGASARARLARLAWGRRERGVAAVLVVHWFNAPTPSRIGVVRWLDSGPRDVMVLEAAPDTTIVWVIGPPAKRAPRGEDAKI
jgi:RNA polymerase sigma-70 factor (ECF subfamily)